MLVTVDSAGRVMLPKQVRDSIGLSPGQRVDVTVYGAGLSLMPQGPTARLVRDEDGLLVAHSDSEVTDQMIRALIDEGRR
jgi:AbrB family looped-hinge helix DNA binding protein